MQPLILTSFLTAPNPARFAKAALLFLRLGSSMGARPSPKSIDELKNWDENKNLKVNSFELKSWNILDRLYICLYEAFPWLEYSEAGGVRCCGQEDDDEGRGRPGRLIRQPHVKFLPECGNRRYDRNSLRFLFNWNDSSKFPSRLRANKELINTLIASYQLTPQWTYLLIFVPYQFFAGIACPVISAGKSVSRR